MNQRYAPQRRKCEEKKCFVERCHEEEHNICRGGEEPGRAILKCSPGASVPNILISITVLTPQTFQLGSVSINTSRLCNPSTLVTISGEITAQLALTTSPGNLVLTRSCKGVEPQVVANFSVLGAIELLAVQPFSFQFCDCNSSCCCDCVTYSLAYVSIPAVAINLSFSNIVLSALAVEKGCDCN